MDLVKELFEGSRLALARSITAVENEYDNAIDIMKAMLVFSVLQGPLVPVKVP